MLVLLLFLRPFVHGQNLVQNGSFENGACPTFASQLNLADYWNNPSLGTPEYYHQCASQASYVKPPHILIDCFQYPRTGDAFIGLFTYRSNLPNVREYAEVELSNALIADRCYYFEMYINHAESHGIVTDGMGVAFTNGSTTISSANVLPLTPAIEHPAGILLSDTMGWMKVSGNYTANGGEDHLIIGNFKPDNATMNVLLFPMAGELNSSYIFVDDVSLVEVNSTLDLGADTILCTGDEIILNAASFADDYLWNDGSIDSTLLVNVPGMYTVTTWNKGCLFSDEVNINFLDLPELNWPVDTTVCNNEPFILVAGDNTNNYEWQDLSSHWTYTVENEGVFYCKVSSECGTSADTIMVHLEKCFCSAYVPNSFTPNDDQVNDVLAVSTNCTLDTYHFLIMNRWGEIVFETTDPSVEWDGMLNNCVLQDGAYSYVLSYQFTDGEFKQKTGHINLLR